MTSSKNAMSGEFQAVVLAGGGGSRMFPLTEGHAKALLPIANEPMLGYSLSKLEKAGFEEVIIVARSAHREPISKFAKESYDGKIRTECHFIEDECGTADALRQLRDKIKKDFVVVSSDLVTDAPLHHIVDSHRTHGATCTSLIYEIPKPEDGKKAKVDPGLHDYMALVKDRLVYTVTVADIEDRLELRQSLLKKFPNLVLSTNLLNAHLFVFKRWVLDLLLEKKHISSIQSELVPFLVNCQWRTSPKHAVGHLIPPSKNTDLSGMSTSEINNDAIKCIAFKMSGGYCGRANTIPGYLDVNRQVLRGASSQFAPPFRIHPDAQVEHAQVGNDSLVGNGTKIEEKTSVKRSIIGSHCTIGKNCKIINSIIMDHVEIESGCKLDGVIVCSNARLQEGLELKDCEVSFGILVEKGVKAKNEKFAESRLLSS